MSDDQNQPAKPPQQPAPPDDTKNVPNPAEAPQDDQTQIQNTDPEKQKEFTYNPTIQVFDEEGNSLGSEELVKHPIFQHINVTAPSDLRIALVNYGGKLFFLFDETLTLPVKHE